MNYNIKILPYPYSFVEVTIELVWIEFIQWRFHCQSANTIKEE